MSDLTNAPAFRAVTTESPLTRALLIATVLALLATLLFAPLIVVFVEALRDGAGAALASLANDEASSAIRLTLLVAAISVPLNALFGIAAAWFITKYDFRGKAFLITLIDLPFSVSPVVAGLCIVLTFGANTTVGGWLIATGHPVVFALPGIILASMFVTFPFVARELIPVMIEQGRAEEEAALTLGASGLRIFWTVTLPNIRWALLYGVLLSNARDGRIRRGCRGVGQDPWSDRDDADHDRDALQRISFGRGLHACRSPCPSGACDAGAEDTS